MGGIEKVRRECGRLLGEGVVVAVRVGPGVVVPIGRHDVIPGR